MKSDEQIKLHARDRQNRNATQWSDCASPVMSVVVPYTTIELTRAALRHAAGSSDLATSVHVIDVQVVPFPCPLDQPPVSQEYARLRVRQLLDESGLPGKGDVVYTRDRLEGYQRVLEPHSIVILATRKRWRATTEKKLGRLLSQAGHQVMVFEPE